MSDADVPVPKGGYDPDRGREATENKAAGIARGIARDLEGLGEFEAVGLQDDTAEALLEYGAEQGAEYVVVSAEMIADRAGRARQRHPALLLNADVTVRIYGGMGHGVNQDELEVLEGRVGRLLE